MDFPFLCAFSVARERTAAAHEMRANYDVSTCQ